MIDTLTRATVVLLFVFFGLVALAIASGIVVAAVTDWQTMRRLHKLRGKRK